MAQRSGDPVPSVAEIDATGEQVSPTSVSTAARSPMTKMITGEGVALHIHEAAAE